MFLLFGGVSNRGKGLLRECTSRDHGQQNLSTSRFCRICRHPAWSGSTGPGVSSVCGTRCLGASGMPRKFTFCRFLRVWTMSDQFRSKNLATWKSVGHLGFCDESCLVATCSVFLDRPKQWAGPLQRIFATLAAPGSPWRFGMFWTIWMV